MVRHLTANQAWVLKDPMWVRSPLLPQQYAQMVEFGRHSSLKTWRRMATEGSNPSLGTSTPARVTKLATVLVSATSFH